MSLYGAMKIAAESLTAQINSLGKLATPRRENRKNRHEKEIQKANEHDGRGCLLTQNIHNLVIPSL
jgi:hypothetical protein